MKIQWLRKNSTKTKTSKEVDGQNDSSNATPRHAETSNNSINPKSAPKRKKTFKPKTTKGLSAGVLATNNSSNNDLDYNNVPSAAYATKQASLSLLSDEVDHGIQNITHIIGKSNNRHE